MTSEKESKGFFKLQDTALALFKVHVETPTTSKSDLNLWE